MVYRGIFGTPARLAVIGAVALLILAIGVSAGAAPVVIATIPVTGGGPTTGAANTVTNRIYVCNSWGGRISVVDGATNAETNSIVVGGNPGSVDLNMATNKVYVAQQSPNNLLVLNMATDTVVKTVPLPAKPYCCAVNPATNKVYIGYDGTNNVSVLNGATDTLMPGSIATGAGSEDIAVNSSTNKVYVARQNTNTVGVIDGSTDTMVKTVTVGNYSDGVGINEKTNKIYVENWNSSDVSVINGATDTVIKTVPVGLHPYGSAVNETTNMVYVGNYNSNTCTVINGATDTRVTDIPVGVNPSGTCVNPVTNRIYQMNNSSSNVSVISDPPGPTPTWYLAEGTTAWGFSTYITIENPNNAALKANVTYMPTGSANVVKSINLPANSQTTINPADVLGEKDFSTTVSCTDATRTIAVDRTMKWTGTGAPTPEAHASIGVPSPATVWYLPEGSSAWGFECWLLVQNPGATDASVNFTYMIEGVGPQLKTHKVKAHSRATFNMETDIGQHDASVMISSDQAVIPERAMYKNSKREGHDSIGTITPAKNYYLAEGTTAWGFTTYVLVQNPQSKPNNVTLTYMTPSGPKVQPAFTMPANSRKTIRVNDVSPANGYPIDISNTDFSTRVTGSAPIIAERAMYWGLGTPLGEACHDSIGMSEAHKTFYLPDGQNTPEDGPVETWTLVQNPNDTNVKIQVTYLNPDGKNNVVFTDTVPKNSRKTYNMADKLEGRAAIKVVSQTPGKKIMVERAMYWNNKGAGTDTIGGFSD